MTDPINGHRRALFEHDLQRAAKTFVANNLYIALKYLDAARATAQAYTLLYPMPDPAPLQSALDTINKDLTRTENQP
jgi:hypothetical protein